jgi:hypothetical protein
MAPLVLRATHCHADAGVENAATANTPKNSVATNIFMLAPCFVGRSPLCRFANGIHQNVLLAPLTILFDQLLVGCEFF